MNPNVRSVVFFVCVAAVLASFSRLFLGAFVIQPIGALPEGATIIYWRSGLNIPFVASADGMLESSGKGVSLFGRAMVMSQMMDPIKERELFRLGYSELLYKWSTNGNTYER